METDKLAISSLCKSMYLSTRFLGLLVLIGSLFASASLTTFGQIKSLEQFSQLGTDVVEQKVDLVATVTHVEPVWNFIFVQDENRAVYVSGINVRHIRAGDRIRLEGIGKKGDVSPWIFCEKFTKVSSGELPKPREISIGNLELGKLDAMYVQTQGVVQLATSGQGHTLLICAAGGREFHVCINGGRRLKELWKLIGAKLRFTGALCVTLEPGSESENSLIGTRKITHLRIASMQEPELLVAGVADTMPLPEDESSLILDDETDDDETDDGEKANSAEDNMFVFGGQVGFADNQFFVLSDWQNSIRIEFEHIFSLSPGDVIRVAAKRVVTDDGKSEFRGLALENEFKTRTPSGVEFQNLDQNKLLWQLVTVKGRPKNVTSDDDDTFYEIEKDGRTARVRLVGGYLNEELLKNTQFVSTRGTVVEADADGNCQVVVKEAKNVLQVEPKVPVWKYIAWALLPISAVFLLGLVWVKNQRDRDASHADSISKINNQLVSTYRAISDGLLAVDNDNRTLFANQKFSKLTGLQLKPGDPFSLAVDALLKQVKKPDELEKFLSQNSFSNHEAKTRRAHD